MNSGNERIADLEVARVEAREHRAQLERDDLDVGAGVAELLRDGARDGHAEAVRGGEERGVGAGAGGGRGEERAGGARIERNRGEVGVGPVVGGDEGEGGVGVAFEEGGGESSAIDCGGDGASRANVGERAAIDPRDEVRDVRAGALRDRDAVLRERRGEREHAQRDVRLPREEAEGARVVVVDGPDDDRMRGAGQGAVVHRFEQDVAAGGAGDAVGAEAVEGAVGIGRAHRLIGAEDRHLEVGEKRRVRTGEDDVHRVRSVRVHALDRFDDLQVP